MAPTAGGGRGGAVGEVDDRDDSGTAGGLRQLARALIM